MTEGHVLVPRRLFFANPQQAKLKLSPDGHQFSYLTPLNGVLNIAVAPVGNLEHSSIITSSRRDILDCWWLYTNGHIAFFSDRAGEEEHALYLVDLARGQTTILTQAAGAQARLAGLSYAYPDRMAIAINDRNPEFHDVCWISASTGTVTRVFENDNFSTLLLDRTLRPALGIETHADGSETWSLHEPSGRWRPLLRIDMDDAIATRPLGFSERGDFLFLADSRGSDTSQLCQIELATGRRDVMSSDQSADVDCVKLHPMSGHPEAVSFYNIRRSWRAVAADIALDIATLGALAGEDFEITSTTLDNQRWIVEANSDHRPKIYFMFDRSTKGLKRVFTSRPELEATSLASTRPVVVLARDGVELLVYLTEPTPRARSQNPSAVFLVHGGPWERHRAAYEAQRHWLADRGHLVVSVNFRGSTGLGKKFLNLGNREWGGRMIDDLIDVAEWIIARRFATRKRIGLMGMSYGGYAGLMALTRPNTPFACCAALASPPDLVALLRGLPRHWQSQMSLFTRRVGDPDQPDDLTMLQVHSPIHQIERLNGPVLIAHGARDIRVGIDQVRSFAEALHARGASVTLIEFPSEGHGLINQRNRLSYFALAETFFATHIGGALEPVEGDLQGADYRVSLGSQFLPTSVIGGA